MYNFKKENHTVGLQKTKHFVLKAANPNFKTIKQHSLKRYFVPYWW